MLDGNVIAGLESPGMRPALQARSRLLTARLINEALILLQNVDFEGISVEALCARADATVGSFYSRFDSKDAFVVAVQRAVVEDTRRHIVRDYETGVAPSDTAAHFLGWVAKSATAWYRRHEGFVRASLRRAGDSPESWVPIREVGLLQRRYANPRLMRILDRPADDGMEDRIDMAFQMMVGALNNMVLINPGPFTIHDPRTARMLARAMLCFIESGGTDDVR